MPVVFSVVSRIGVGDWQSALGGPGALVGFACRLFVVVIGLISGLVVRAGEQVVLSCCSACSGWGAVWELVARWFVFETSRPVASRVVSLRPIRTSLLPTCTQRLGRDGVVFVRHRLLALR